MRWPRILSSFGTPFEIRDLPGDRALFTVSWNLSDVCNYKCSYCEEELNGGRFKFPPLEKALSFLGALEKVTAGKQVVFDLKGGEPTLWKDLPQLAAAIRQRGWQSVIVTNGSRRPEWWAEHGGAFDIVCLSFHAGQASVEHFIEVIRLLGTRAVCGVLVPVDPAKFEETKEAVGRIRETYPALSVTPTVLAIPNGGGRMYTYSAEQKQWMSERPIVESDGQVFQHFSNPGVRGGRERVEVRSSWRRPKVLSDDELKNRGLNAFRGWSCSAGLNRLHIETDGRIYRGQCRIGDDIGSIYSDDLVLPTQPVKCEMDFCFSGPEVMLPKSYV